MSIPSWINQLKDSTLLADMTAAAANGVISEVEMSKLFVDLSTKLTSSHITLSTSQYSDLQTIAVDLNVGVSTSEYVTYITKALVNGNALNANWQGGATSSIYLGNLSVGSSAQQLTELMGKWFLGTDLPSVNNITGINASSISYSYVSGSVFNSNGPQITDINQGQLGDCYLCSSLAEVAARNPGVIQSMIIDNGNNTYGVRFYVNGSVQYITVNNQLPNGGTLFDHGTALWGSLVEKAYAQLQAQPVLASWSSAYSGNSYATIGDGGYPWVTLEQVTGATSLTNFVANSSHTGWTINSIQQNLSTQTMSTSVSTQAVMGMIITDLANGNDLVLSSYTNAKDASGKTTLVASHAFSIYGYDNATGLLEVRNPWGTAIGSQTYATTFEVSLSTLLAAGDIITADNLQGISLSSQATNVLAATAADSQASSAITTITVVDTAFNVTVNLDSLAANYKITSITLSDINPVLTITSNALVSDAVAIQKIGGVFSVNVLGTGVSHLNTAIYTDISSNFTITVLSTNSNEVQHLANTNGALADTTYSNVQRLQFSNTMVALDVAPNQNAGEVYMLYKATFGRAPEAGGMGFWLDKLDKGADLTKTLSAYFVTCAEFTARYGDKTSDTTYINNIYKSLYNRDADAGGAKYWTDKLSTGTTRAEILSYFATLPEGAALVANELTHGIVYTQWVG
jgi:hypothetical protein